MTLHPDYPAVFGPIRITSDWKVCLPDHFNRRIDEGNLVFWRPGLTLWIAAWDRDPKENKTQTLNGIKENVSPHAKHVEEIHESELVRFSYELQEEDPAQTPSRYTALYSFIIGELSYIQAVGYADATDDLHKAYQVVRSFTPVAP